MYTTYRTVSNRSDELLALISDLIQANGADYFWKNLMFLLSRTSLQSAALAASGPPPISSAAHAANSHALSAEKVFEIAALRDEIRQLEQRTAASDAKVGYFARK